MATEISSPQNQHIKNMVRLTKRRARDARRVTLVEGVRELSHALAAGHLPRETYACRDLIDGDADACELLARIEALDRSGVTQLFWVSRAAYAKVAYRAESQGVVAVVPYVDRSLHDLNLSVPAFVVIIEGAEKPGNLGAILRTADAAGVDGLIVCDGQTDLHNPNTVRASLGALFTVPISEASSQAGIDWLQEQRIRIVAALPDATERYSAVDLTGSVAIVMGSEAAGLSPLWRDAADLHVHIPMQGQVDSLNLATSTALMLYEVVRQRARSLPPSAPSSKGE